MPRLPRIHVEGSIYYVTCQSHHSNQLFKDSKDYSKYLNLLAASKNKYQFKLFSYCLLPKKVYLLIDIKSKSSISDVMFNLNSSYTKYYNARHSKKGPVLEGRFKSKWVEKRTYLLPLTGYIHLLSKEKNCLYSSYSAFLGKPSPVPITDEVREVLSLLPQKMDYKTYLEEIDSKELKSLKQELARNRFLGSKEFRQRIKTALKAYKENKKKEVAIEKVEVVQRNIPKNLRWWSVGVTVLLLLLAGYFYNRQLSWKEELRITQKEFEQKLTELEQAQVQVQVEERSSTPQYVLLGEEKKDMSTPLEGVVWRVKLGPISSESSQDPQIDILKFKEGKFTSNILNKEGFAPSNYSIRYKEKGVIIWETMQSGNDGAIASWHGKWNGEVMKGVLSRKFPGKEAKTFSFIGRIEASA